MTTTDIVGYIASVLLMVCFTMKNVTKLRIINSCACVFWVAYGVLLGSIPVMITNSFILCVNIYHITTSRKKTV